MVAKNAKIMHTELAPQLSYDRHAKAEQFKTKIYDPQTKAFLGRTASSWGKIGLFYLVFYGVLVGLIAICYGIFYQTIDPRRPRWQLDSSLIGTNPGLGYRPLPPVENVQSTLIWFNGHDEQSMKHWINSLTEFLEEYRKPGLVPGRGANIYNCDYRHPPPAGKVCAVDVKEMHPCTFENDYNYVKAGPCIFLKLNKIFGWKPEYYDTTNLPEKMPKHLKEHIAHVNRTDPIKMETIWVSCEGENPADKENIGEVEIIPRQGFPGYFYPYENSEGYLSPIVAVHFKKPINGIVINVECKAWARNIKHHREDKIGSVHFELLID